MINMMEVTETNKMVEQENLDVRTITMGINLLDCAGPDLAQVNEKIYNYNMIMYVSKKYCTNIFYSCCFNFFKMFVIAA